MIEVRDLTKRFGATTAVDGLSFTVRPGRVTGFLGPNGAGKSTTMRMMVGLDRPDAGTATVGGRPYRAHPAPLCAVGALLEGRAVHRGRTARQHLLGLARTHGIPARRVAEVLATAGLAEAADRRAGGFSLGMSQRLGVASALLGDPAVLILDEPVNGLDPDGVLWIRTLLKDLAAQGRTVLVSSHLMSETAVTADHLLIIGAGRLLADVGIEELIARAGTSRCLVRSPDPAGLRAAVVAAGATVTGSEQGSLVVAGLDAEEIGAVAAAHGVILSELTPHRASLEQAYMELTRGWIRFHNEVVPS
ncbi:ABC transporter ATP-binding protein [Paractinoplanes rishiriensis]|uniref:Multidrug ABC transporter ATP-binding protein n=1 Tax=Paractinoplanes rishiriensis TaxID=1050105 RepID=A0A919K7D2_9ACTN|nr:ATP-binding cassette domain-containing protein [Actinoplanes rishiriensis]GIF01429.1 multidrug ABC transporter ATP-binding protein [Actinoplanes rishiriensis]